MINYIINSRDRIRLLPFLVLIYAGLFAYPAAVSSQTSTVDVYTAFHNIGLIGGLADVRVNTLCQDEQGFVWIGTDNGLFRYDGYEFFARLPAEDDPFTVSSMVINSIDIDKRGGIWVGTDNGLNYYDRENDRFIRYMYEPGNPLSIRHNHVRKLSSENNGLILVETLDGTLTVFDRSGEKTRHFRHDQIRQPYYRYHALYQDEQGYAWIGGRSLGLHRIDLTTGNVFRYEADPARSDRKRENDISLVHVGADGQWYVAGLDGFYRFFPESGDFERVLGTTSYNAVNDSEGNVWIGTGNGLVRYNNEDNTIRHFRFDPDIPWSIRDNRVNAVLHDRDGNIWAGTDNGLSFLSSRNNRFKNYTYITGNASSLSSGNISAIIEDSKKRLWVGTRDNGLNLWDEGGERFVRFTAGGGELTSDNVSTLYEDSSGELWTGLWAGLGFDRHDESRKVRRSYAIDPNSRSRDWYNAFYEDVTGAFWLGVWGYRGLTGFDRERETIIDWSFIADNIPYRFDINDVVIQGDDFFIVDRQGTRVYRYNRTRDEFIAAAGTSNKPPPSHVDRVLNVLPEFTGRLNYLESGGEDCLFVSSVSTLIRMSRNLEPVAFTGTDSIVSMSFSGDRLVVLHPDALSFYSAHLEKSGRFDLPARFAAGDEVAACPDGSIFIRKSGLIFYFDTASGMLTQIHESDDAFIPFIRTRDGMVAVSGTGFYRLGRETVTSAGEWPGSGLRYGAGLGDDRVLLFYDDGTLKSYDTRTGDLSVIELPRLTDEFLSMFSFMVPADENTLLLVSGTEIHLADTRQAGKKIINRPDSKSLTSHLVTAITGEKNGVMWVGTSDGGLNRVSADRQTINHFLPDGSDTTLAGLSVTCLYFDSDSNLWIGTGSGVSLINSKTGKIERVGKDWPVTAISCIVQDSRQFMWIGGDRGLVRLCRQSGKWNHYTESDGLPSSVFSRAAVRRSDGRLVFGTRKGMTIIDPDRFIDEPDRLPVSISFFEALGKRVKSNFKPRDTVYIDHKSNFITIGYSTMSYHHPALTSFYYRLSGLNENWMESRGNSVDFTNLHPGTYTFYAALSMEEKPETAENSLTIIVIPPVHQTLWFRLLLIILITGGLSAVLATYIHQLNLKHRSARFEQRLLLSQMNPHFVFNSLSAVQSFIYTSNPSEASDYLSDFSRLMRLILENSRAEEVPLSRELQALKLYFRLQKLRFFDKFDYEIIVSPEIATQMVLIPPMLIQPFIENSIEHGILHKEAKGFVTLEITMEKDYITASVTDDGIGLARSREINAGRDKNHHSLATSITSERLNNLYKKGRKKTKLDIFDRYETEGVNGTRVDLMIPCRIIAVTQTNDVNAIIFREDRYTD
jgi:ligand-binding sensor domain-containing protein